MLTKDSKWHKYIKIQEKNRSEQAQDANIIN